MSFKLTNQVTDNSCSCFIATAAYSTSVHPDLDTFREFRDQKLMRNYLGKILVSLYYKISPAIAKYIEKQPSSQKTVPIYSVSHVTEVHQYFVYQALRF
ncbi:MAG TPA: CFI-box-CTERM domain-containing protein [Oculatellaceae cyanobacterium]|jgi:hypothetical protein